MNAALIVSAIERQTALFSEVVELWKRGANTPAKEAGEAPRKVSSGQQWTVSSEPKTPVLEPQIVTVYTRDRIVEAGREYTRETHPLLFAVVDWMEVNPEARGLSVRKLAAEFETDTKTSVSKSWAAVAKNYWTAQTDESEETDATP